MSTQTAWRNAVLAIFAANGLALATLLARLPTLRDHLGLATGEVGVLLLFLSAGSIGGLIASGSAIHVLGTRRTMRAALAAGGVATGLVGLAGGVLENVVATAVAIALFGACSGLTDVAMNVDGAAAERALRRHVMPWFHAAFSGGTIAGAGLGALGAWLGVPIGVHACIMGAVIVAIAVVATRWVPDAPVQEGRPKPGFAERMSVWRDRRILLIGLLVLGFAYAEGAANDWLTIGMVDDRGLSDGQGALMLTVFTVAMTLGRVLGPPILDRHGRVAVLQVTATMSVVGLAIVIFVPVIPIAVVGIVLWGLGASLGFPVGMSAAADDPDQAATRVSAVALVGYLAFLVGPPVVGFLGEQVGTLRALTLVLGLLLMAGLLAPAARKEGE